MFKQFACFSYAKKVIQENLLHFLTIYKNKKENNLWLYIIHAICIEMKNFKFIHEINLKNVVDYFYTYTMYVFF